MTVLNRDISRLLWVGGFVLLICGLTCKEVGAAHAPQAMASLVLVSPGCAARTLSAPDMGQEKRAIRRRPVRASVLQGASGWRAGARLIRAIHLVENPQNRPCKHAAQGPLQIQPGVVRDLNRHGWHFTLAGRFDYAKSAAMFAAYTKLQEARDDCEAARIWNQGSGGKNNKSAWAYWAKIKKKGL